VGKRTIAAARTCAMCAKQATLPDTCQVPDHMASGKLSKKMSVFQKMEQELKIVPKLYYLGRNNEDCKPDKKSGQIRQ